MAVFNLPAVVRFDRYDLRELLLGAMNESSQQQWGLEDVNWKGNAQKVIIRHWKKHLQEPPENTVLETIAELFTAKVKAYFVSTDDAFEIRPGVQSIFGHIEKDKNWKYCIISDYWQDVTHFMLQSCGVFSKDKLTLTAEDALTPEEQIQCAARRLVKKEKHKTEIYLVNGDQTRIKMMLKREVTPPFEKDKQNYFYYPRFSKLFKVS